MCRMLISLLLLVAIPAPASSLTEKNKAIALRVFDEVLTKGDFVLGSQLYAPEFINHGRTKDVSLEVDHAAARGWLVAFPDLKIEPEIAIAERDLVAILWRATGTNLGAANGIPATGKRIDGRGITIWRIVDGKVTEEWSEFSQLMLLQQLGLMPGGPDTTTQARPPGGMIRPSTSVSARERERNRAIARTAFEEAVGRGNLEIFRTLHDMRELAPDLRVEVPLAIAEGDLVAVMYIAEGTNTGSAMGYPATGKRARLRGMSIMRVRRGKITDEWSVLDQYQVLDALGLLPQSAAAN